MADSTIANANSSNNSRLHLRVGSIVVLNLQRSAQKNLIKVPYQAMYGTDRLYKIVANRLALVKVKTIGEYRQTVLQQDSIQMNQSQLLIKSEELQDGDEILTTHLPNAFTGLKVESTDK